MNSLHALELNLREIQRDGLVVGLDRLLSERVAHAACFFLDASGLVDVVFGDLRARLARAAHADCGFGFEAREFGRAAADFSDQLAEWALERANFLLERSRGVRGRALHRFGNGGGVRVVQRFGGRADRVEISGEQRGVERD